MPAPSCSAEVVIVGAGPAGCAAAIRLAQLGHEVLLVERGGPGRPAALESAPAVLLPLLQSLGLGEALLAARFQRPGHALLQWAGPAQDVPEREPGFQLERLRFDALLRQGARAAGVRWLAPATARFPQAGTNGGDAGWRLPLHDGRVIGARAVLWAAGRAGTPLHEGWRNAALAGQWQLAHHDASVETGDDAGAVRVQAGREGWAWLARGPGAQATAVLFVDARRLRGGDAAARTALYRDELAGLGLIAPVLAGARLTALRVADATPRWQPVDIGPLAWRIGEAALSLDPLSSQGVVSALRGGVQAAVALHTACCRPQAAALAGDFLRDQQVRELQRHRRWSQAFHAEAARAWPTPFWLQRAQPMAGDESLVMSHPSAARPLPALASGVCLAPRARVAPAAMLEGDWIAAAPVLDHPALGAPVAQVAGVPVASLLRVLGSPVSTAAVLQAWAGALGPQAATELFQRWWRLGVLDDAAGSTPPSGPAAGSASGTRDRWVPEVSMGSAGTSMP